MNQRLKKVSDEIERLRRKITEYQSRLRDLERTKTELENAGIVAMVRDIDVPPDEFAAFVRMFKERENCAVPDIPGMGAENAASIIINKEVLTVEE